MTKVRILFRMKICGRLKKKNFFKYLFFLSLEEQNLNTMAAQDKKKRNSEPDPSIIGATGETIHQIKAAWDESGNAPPVIRPELPDEDLPILRKRITDCIESSGGEISRQARIIHLALLYILFTEKARQRFFEMLLEEYDTDWLAVDDMIHRMFDEKKGNRCPEAECELREKVIPPRVRLLMQFINIPNGFIFMKDMRADLMSMTSKNPCLVTIGEEIKNILTAYFDVNLLNLHEITWNSPASLLERLMQFEAVHEMHSWAELRKRLMTDRRVYAFFHPKMPAEPLIFVEVALVKGIARNISEMIDPRNSMDDLSDADTAIFYSISNTQKGLTGISFGNFLIKKVVRKINADFPDIKTFATLSPIPGFRKWLTNYLAEGGNPMLKQRESDRICKLSGCADPAEGIRQLLERKNWHTRVRTCETLKRPLMRLCTHYLLNEKGKTQLRAADPVANFHLSNGAKIEHVNWLADTSARGIKQSAGIMVNYHYRIDKIVVNHENYQTEGIIHASSDARSWL